MPCSTLVRLVPATLIALCLSSAPAFAVGTGIFAGAWTGPCTDEGGGVFNLDKTVDQWRTLPSSILLNNPDDPFRPLRIEVGQLASDQVAGGQTTSIARWNDAKTAMEIHVSRLATAPAVAGDTAALVNLAYPAYAIIKLSLNDKGNLVWDEADRDTRDNFALRTLVCELHKK